MDSDPGHRGDLLASLSAIFGEKDGILLAYMFGSYVRADCQNPNDIDIGLYVGENILSDPWFQVNISRELNEKISSKHEFDVRILNHSSVPFNQEVITKGIRLLVRDEQLRVDFETRVLLTWYDMKPTWEAFFKAQSEALMQ